VSSTLDRVSPQTRKRSTASHLLIACYTGVVQEHGHPKSPGEILKELLSSRGWTQDQLAAITGRSRRALNDIAVGKAAISPDMAITLAAAFGNSAEEWMNWDASYRLFLARKDTSAVARTALLHSLAPISHMQRRGWIGRTSSPDELEAELERFFGCAVDGELTFSVAARRTVALPILTPSERAWCFRARQLARSLLANPFSPERLGTAQSALRRLAAHPKEARHLPRILAEYGIRFVVIEPLPDAKIDGAAFWDDVGPVIAVSIRYDRIDGFWFTVMHEFSHIRTGDPLSVDTGLVDATKGININLTDDEAEAKANSEAASSLVPSAELESFIRRVGPLYSRERIIQFANRIKIHPGIIVGQLQHRKELGYMAMRDFLVKVREGVVSTALTDGWGQTIAAPSTGGGK
jgi:HTH-type transcriptional regulator/antitoxin HigA